MAFYSQTVTLPPETATLLVPVHDTNTMVLVQTTDGGITIGDASVDADGWLLGSFMMSFLLAAGDEIYAFSSNTTGSATIQVLVN